MHRAARDSAQPSDEADGEDGPQRRAGEHVEGRRRADGRRTSSTAAVSRVRPRRSVIVGRRARGVARTARGCESPGTGDAAGDGAARPGVWPSVSASAPSTGDVRRGRVARAAAGQLRRRLGGRGRAQQDPGLPADGARARGQAWVQLRRLGELDAPELARALMATDRRRRDAGSVVADAAVDFCSVRRRRRLSRAVTAAACGTTLTRRRGARRAAGRGAVTGWHVVDAAGASTSSPVTPRSAIRRAVGSTVRSSEPTVRL